jgi:hypothetical protein
METYSQCAQDLFVLNLLGKGGTYLDLGCYLPKKINNTYLLEENGWTGISLDIENYSKEWEVRKNRFIQADCLSLDYKVFLKEEFGDSESVIDYLSIDMELLGDRFKLLSKVMESGYHFKIITIEHDSHLGEDFIEGEKNKQFHLLKSLGYYLLCDDVSNHRNPSMFYEDWWINPKFLNPAKHLSWQSQKSSCSEILSKNDINYQISEISADWSDYKIK